MSKMEPVEQFILKALGAKAHVDPRQIERSATFVEDLNLASLEALEVLMAIEDRFTIDIPDEDSCRFATVGDLIDDVAVRIENAGQAQQPARPEPLPTHGSGQPPASTLGAVRSQVFAIIHSVLGLDPEQLSETLSFRHNLATTSLERLEILRAVEKAFDLELPGPEQRPFTTLGSVINYVIACQAGDLGRT